MNSEQRVAALIAAATARRAANTARRQRLQKAREHGLIARHRLKLQRLQQTPDNPPDPEGDAA